MQYEWLCYNQNVGMTWHFDTEEAAKKKAASEIEECVDDYDSDEVEDRIREIGVYRKIYEGHVKEISSDEDGDIEVDWDIKKVCVLQEPFDSYLNF